MTERQIYKIIGNVSFVVMVISQVLFWVPYLAFNITSTSASIIAAISSGVYAYARFKERR